MSGLPWLKWVEVLGVLVAGIGFGWWQLRDVRRAQEATRRARLAREAEALRETTPSLTDVNDAPPARGDGDSRTPS